MHAIHYLRALVVGLAAAAVVLLPAIAWGDVAPVPDLTRGQARTLMLSALAGLAILGFGMVALIWLGARFTHRYRHGSASFQPPPRPGEHDWADKPLRAPSQPDA